MECTHGQLCTWFADGLSGNDADSFADFYVTACCQVSAVALSADAVCRVAGQHRADLQSVIVLFNFRSLFVSDFHILLSDDFASLRVHDIFQRAASGDAVCQRFDQAVVFFDLHDFDAFAFIHAYTDDRNVSGQNLFSSISINDGACCKNNISAAVKSVFFKSLACEMNGQVMTHSVIIFLDSFSGAEVECLRFRFSISAWNNDSDGFNQMAVQEGDIVSIEGLALDEEDFTASAVDDVFIEYGSEECRFQAENGVLYIRTGCKDAFFTVEVQYLYVAVFFADDDVLGDIDETAGQVTGVCCTQCGIGQTLRAPWEDVK